MHDHYQPNAPLLKAYAQVLVDFALNSGQGIKPGEVVECVVPDIAKPLALALQKQVLTSGGHPMVRLIPTGFDFDFYSLASHDQLTFFPEKYLRGKTELLDHQIVIMADPDPFELKDVDPSKIIKARDAKKAYRDWLMDKENQGQFTWTVGSWGVAAKAKIVGLSLAEYWQQIIKACFLDLDNPIAEWRRVFKLQQKIKDTLNQMPIETIKVKGPDVNIEVKIGPERLWEGGSGRNIPSFEIFTSPDWRGSEGFIKFNQPLYRYGNVIKDIELEFYHGQVVKAQAQVGNQFLQQMLKSPNADKIGEFSLTDQRMSRITHPMADTLFDENMGGPFGNMHLAIGMAYKTCYKGDYKQLQPKDWEKLGYNDSAEHTDIVTTSDRTVTAILNDGRECLIYQKGRFMI